MNSLPPGPRTPDDCGVTHQFEKILKWVSSDLMSSKF